VPEAASKGMKTLTVPEKELADRRERVRKELLETGIEGLFVVQEVDLFYLTGALHPGVCYLPAEGEALLFFNDSCSSKRAHSDATHIFRIASLNEIPGVIHDVCGRLPRVMGFEFDVLPVTDFNLYGKLFPDQECVDGSPAILKGRMIKSAWELAQMERTAELTRRTFDYGRSVLKPGLSEMEFASMLESFARVQGRETESVRVRDYQTEGYPGHVLSGESGGKVGLLDSPASGQGTSPAFPCGAGPRIIQANEPVMVDFGFGLKGYHMDETRMFSIGPMPEEIMKACEAAIAIHDEVLSRVKPGVTVDELFEHSVASAEILGYAEQYLGPPGQHVSFVGHGIGLELIEGPIIAKGKKDRLEPGMTFALEPKIVFEDAFIAGVESVFVVTEEGYRFISRLPVEVFIC
jgi:Xaa-Pro aminopeptidase